MKTEIFWIPLLSASLLCAGSSHTTRITTAGSSQDSSPQEDAGQPHPSLPDAGPGDSLSGDAGTSISFPGSTEMLRGDVSLDGAAFKAIRVAMEDLKPRNRTPPGDKVEACFDDESAYDIQVQKRSNLYFVSIVMIPERCDPTGVYVDGGVRYVIDPGGHILLKRYDGQR
jgi:hypothetical protein